MTKEELKKKIVEVVNQWHMFQNRDMNGHTIWLTNDSEKLADALIEAGLGDVETTRKIGAHATAMAVLQAEKALDIACQTYNDCLDSISNCFHGSCYRYDPDCKDCLKTYSQEQAEKELAEEREDD